MAHRIGSGRCVWSRVRMLVPIRQLVRRFDAVSPLRQFPNSLTHFSSMFSDMSKAIFLCLGVFVFLLLCRGLAEHPFPAPNELADFRLHLPANRPAWSRSCDGVLGDSTGDPRSQQCAPLVASGQRRWSAAAAVPRWLRWGQSQPNCCHTPPSQSSPPDSRAQPGPLG